MKRLGNLEEGRRFTTGEKAIAVMLAAGVFGYWAGFNLSGVALEPFPVTKAAAQPATVASPVSRPADDAAHSGEPRAPMF
jgi:hypothetical protein